MKFGFNFDETFHVLKIVLAKNRFINTLRKDDMDNHVLKNEMNIGKNNRSGIYMKPQSYLMDILRLSKSVSQGYKLSNVFRNNYATWLSIAEK